LDKRAKLFNESNEFRSAAAPAASLMARRKKRGDR
jgi:hypothetical protein